MLQEHLKKPLAEMILFGELAENGGNVAVTVKKEKGKSIDALFREEFKC